MFTRGGLSRADVDPCGETKQKQTERPAESTITGANSNGRINGWLRLGWAPH